MSFIVIWISTVIILAFKIVRIYSGEERGKTTQNKLPRLSFRLQQALKPAEPWKQRAEHYEE